MLKKSSAFLAAFALSLILTHCRDVLTLSFSQSKTPKQKSTTMVMYALSTPADLPGLSRKSDRETEHLFGRVKSVTREQFHYAKVLWLFTRKQSVATSTISFNLEGNKTEETFSDTGARSLRKTSTGYDAQGRKISRVMYWRDAGTSTCSYNYHGNEIEAVEEFAEQNSIITRRYIASYNSQGKQIEARYSEGGGDSKQNQEQKAFYRYKYTDGRLTELSTVNAEGFVYYRVVYSYDASGRLISELAYRPDGRVHKKDLFSYEGRKKAERISFNEDGSQLGYVELYDDKDNVVDVSGLEQNGNACCKTVRKYEYDQTGNWIKQTIQSVDAVTSKVIAEWFEERTIEYY